MKAAQITKARKLQRSGWMSLVLVLALLAPCMHCLAHSAPTPEVPACHDSDSTSSPASDSHAGDCECHPSVTGAFTETDLYGLINLSKECSGPELPGTFTLATWRPNQTAAPPDTPSPAGARLHLIHCVFLD